jgi:phosphate transport system substrate-binding protein
MATVVSETKYPGRERPRALWVLWGLVIAIIALAILTSGIIIYDLQRGSPPNFSQSENLSKLASSIGSRSCSAPILMAGSGSNLNLTKELMRGFSKQQPNSSFTLAPSIGSSGGIQAVRDEAVSIGLISRPLTDKEKQFGLTVVPYARSAVVVAAHLSVPDHQLSVTELLDIYRGARRYWSDGNPIIVLQREQGDSSHAAINRVVPAFAQVNEECYRQKRWRVLYSDNEMQTNLLATPGAIGLMDLGAILSQRLPLTILAIDGVEPSVQNFQAGRYPYHKDLALVMSGPACDRLTEFLHFIFSNPGRRLIEETGYLPLGEMPP